MPHIVSAALTLTSGVLVMWDLIISKKRAIEINRYLHRWLTLDTVEKTYWVVAILAAVGMGGIIRYLIWLDSQTVSSRNVSWVPIFAGGFVVGLAVQWFLIKALWSWVGRFRAIFVSTGLLTVLASVIFVATVHYSSILAVALAIGLGYSPISVAFSTPVAKFFEWFSTTDPNPDTDTDPNPDTDRKTPRVLARIGLLFFIVAGIIELVVSLI